MNISRYNWVLATAFVAGCTAIGAMQFEQQFGPEEPRERAVETLSAENEFDRGHRTWREQSQSLPLDPPEGSPDDSSV